MQTSSPHLVILEPGTESTESSLYGKDSFDGDDSRKANGSYATTEPDGEAQSPTKRAKLRSLGHKAKEKTRRLLNGNDAKALGGEEEVTQTIKGDPAFNPGYLRDTQKKSKRESAMNAMANLGSVGAGLVHPVDAIKGKATRTTAGKLSKVQRPFLSKDADLEFLEAHNELDRAESTRASRQATSDDDRDSLIEGHRDKVEQLKAQRESLRVAWTTTRFVTRVRVVPKRHFEFPKQEAFIRNPRDQRSWANYDWMKWIGHVRLTLHLTMINQLSLCLLCHRSWSGTRKISVPNTSMNLTSCRMILMLLGVTLNV